MRERILESLSTAKYLAEIERDHLLSYVISIAILQAREAIRRDAGNLPGREIGSPAGPSVSQEAWAS